MEEFNQVYFKGIQRKIVESIDKSEKKIFIAVAWITDEYILNKLLTCQKRGVKVSIVFYSDKINNKDIFKKLYDNGAQIKFTNKLMHNKFCVIDDAIVLNGSYNWTNNASNNDENIQITYGVSNIIEEYTFEFERIFKNAIPIDDYFKNNDEKFIDYLKSIKYPLKYPLFIKINFSEFVIISDSLMKLQSNTYYYLFIKSKDDFDYLHDFIFNNIIRNINYKYQSLKLPIFENIYETRFKIYENEFDIQYYDFSELNEYELFDKKNYIKLDDKTYGVIRKQPIEELYVNLFTYKNKFPDNIKSIDELKDFVKLQYKKLDLDHNKLDHKIYFTNVELLILYKIYFQLPLNFNEHSIVNYKNENNDKLIYYYFESDEYIVRSALNKSKTEFYLMNQLGESISEKKPFKDSCEKYKDDCLEQKYGKKIFSVRKNHIIYYEKFSNNHYGEVTNRKLYGLLDREGKEILPALFDYIEFESSEKIVFEILPIFYTLAGSSSYNYLTKSGEEYIFSYEKNRILKFEYLIFEKKLKQVKFNKSNFDCYLTDSNCNFANFYKTIIFITQNKEEIEYVKSYLINNNLLNVEKELLNKAIESKISEIRTIKKNKISNQNCYVATLLYEDINHPKVEFLRCFRDKKISNSCLGRKFIKIYYRYSPSIVAYLRNRKIVNVFLKFVLDFVIKILKLFYKGN